MNSRAIFAIVVAFATGVLAGIMFPGPMSYADGIYQRRMKALEIENTGLVKQVEALEEAVAALQAEREEVRRVLDADSNDP